MPKAYWISAMLILQALLAWLLILALAIANGIFRESVLIPALGPGGGLVASGLLLSLLIALVAGALVRLKDVDVPQALRIGTGWLALTLAFEFAFGRFVQHKPWEEILAAYAFRDGNLWPLVLAVTLLAPPAAALLQAKSKHARRRTDPGMM